MSIRQVFEMAFNAERLVSIDYGPSASVENESFEGGVLDEGEKLDGSPTVTVATVTSPALTTSNESVNESESAKTIGGRMVSAGEAVQFKVLGGAQGEDLLNPSAPIEERKYGTRYLLLVEVDSDATPPQHFADYFELWLVNHEYEG